MTKINNMIFIQHQQEKFTGFLKNSNTVNKNEYLKRMIWAVVAFCNLHSVLYINLKFNIISSLFSLWRFADVSFDISSGYTSVVRFQKLTVIFWNGRVNTWKCNYLGNPYLLGGIPLCMFIFEAMLHMERFCWRTKCTQTLENALHED